MNGPRSEWCDDTCGICPAQELGEGEFDVVARPHRLLAFDRSRGWRTDPSGTPVCVHPYRVNLPPGRYASAGEPIPQGSTTPEPTAEALELPSQLDDLEGWLVARLRVANDSEIFSAVGKAEREASQRFAPGEVVAALRRVLSHELARR